MAEEHIRNSRFAYSTNANLVLQADRETRRVRGEATGEVETIKWDKADMRMGDRVMMAKPEEYINRVARLNEKKRERDTGEFLKGGAARKRRKRAGDASTITETDNFSGYKPKTRDTKAVYEKILGFLLERLGDVGTDEIRGAAQESLLILKNENLRDSVKQSLFSSLVGTKISDGAYHEILTYAKDVTDFSFEDDVEGDGKAGGETAGADANDMGVAVVVDDDDGDEAEAEELDVVRDSDDEDDDGKEETKMDARLGRTGDDDADVGGEADSFALSVHDIDAYWLQRRLSTYFEDATEAQRLSEQVLSLLQVKDERDCENKLVLLLEYDKFDFIKLLLRNRSKIVYCTRLKQAQNDTERAVIEKEMLNDAGDGAAILEALLKKKTAASWSEDRTTEFANKARAEARRLNRSAVTDGAATALAGSGDVEGTEDEVVGEASKVTIKKNLNLDDLEFAEGGHLMTNKRCELPDSWRLTKPGYEEIHVPASAPKPMAAGERLISISELPEWAHAAFKGMKTLNRVQSKLFETTFNSPENILLCAPTGAGKTNVAVLSVLHQLGLHRSADGSFDVAAFKVVYVAPMKALVQEVVKNFNDRLGSYGINVRELSGDAQLTKAQIEDTQIIVTTPEKWDIITRKAGDRAYTQLVKLVIIDEIHLLHDERGPVLESIVARTLRQIETTGELVRLVGLSATLPNYEDVALFLRVKPDKGLFYFDSTYRPVPLEQQFIGITEQKPFKRQQIMNEICYTKVLEQAGKNQVLVFVHSRKDTVKTAQFMRERALDDDTLSKFVKEGGSTHEILREEAGKAKSKDLADLLPFGFAVHHAGLQRQDRERVEDLFANGFVQVLVSTMTLAWGVNLPAHSVIIKGTQIYDPEKGAWVELSPQDVVQMLGRAGRPQYDTRGEGIIITKHAELQYYLSLMNQQLPIESQFISKLADNLNAEVVMGTVQNVREGMLWLGSTYLYVRMLRSPQLYGIPFEEAEEDEHLVQRRIDLINAAAASLAKNNLVKYDRRSGTLQSTPLGRVAAHYYIVHPSIATYNEFLKPSMSDIELFRLFSLSYEFRNVVVRQEEKMELERLMQLVPIPVKESFEEPSAKINVLLQAYIARKSLNGFALLSDMVYVTQSAGRILRALFEIALKRKWAALSIRLLNFCKMVDHRMWMSQFPLRQFALPEVVLKKLESNQLPSWERYYDLTAAELGEKVRNPGIGRNLFDFVRQIPRLSVTPYVLPITPAILQVELVITADFLFEEKVHGTAQGFHIFIEDVDGETMLHHEWFLLKLKYKSLEHSLKFIVALTEPLQPQYFIRVVSDRWICPDTVRPIPLNTLILPQKFPRHTELLDLKPLPISALGERAFEALYEERYKQFNPIQTQVFPALYESDENAIIAAPTGSGKTVCAEFALLRMLRYNNEGTAVYVAPLQDIADQRYRDWKVSFGAGLGIQVAQLTGELTADLAILKGAQIVISTPEQWDILSRKWQQRKEVQNISLFIVDELHLIGGEAGPTLEMILSRMRFMANQLSKKIRIVALSSSLANARDVGGWLGAAVGKGLFNFHPNVRPVPLEIHVQGFDVDQFSARMLAMAKPVYNSIVAHSPTKSAIVFVPSRRQAQMTAVDIMTFAVANATPGRFLHLEGEAMSDGDKVAKPEWLDLCSDITLKWTLAHGVAFYHEGLKLSDRQLVEKLYNSGIVQVVVLPAKLCWSTDFTSHMVTIMDTCQFDGRTHSYEDYPVYDILQMMGRACRPNVDDGGTCVLFCRSAKKEFYMKFLFSPLPVESHLNHYLADHLNAEIHNKTIENKQEAVDYLTWTFYYRRIVANPNYYKLTGVTSKHLSDHFSELIENTLKDLSDSKCIEIEEDFDLSALNLGMIASYYYIQYTTIELFSSSLAQSTRFKGLLQIVAAASEYSSLSVRPQEMKMLLKLATHLDLVAIESMNPANFKAYVLLQAHFFRHAGVKLTAELKEDQQIVLKDTLRLLQAAVDVVSSQGWYKPAIAAMLMSQQVVQSVKTDDSLLLQIPYFNKDMVALFAKLAPEVENPDPSDIANLEDDVREKLLPLPASQLREIAKFVDSYPSEIEVAYNVEEAEGIETDSTVNMAVQLSRGEDDDEEITEVPAVICPFFPKVKQEGWWLVVSDGKDSLLHVKKVTLKSKLRSKVTFPAPSEAGEYTYKLELISDSYLGCDQSFDFTFNVSAGDIAEEGEADEKMEVEE